ncbi:MAG: hypothetical protein FWF38_00420 [Spirochaetaceae bacterium]|nr:hypothetical protein [Spirochaetaceae bacterium]
MPAKREIEKESICEIRRNRGFNCRSCLHGIGCPDYQGSTNAKPMVDKAIGSERRPLLNCPKGRFFEND